LLRITAAPVTLPVNATPHNVVEEVVDVAEDLPRSRPLPHGETESIRTTLASVALASVAAIAGLVKGSPPE
jgi:hypothetical protein